MTFSERTAEWLHSAEHAPASSMYADAGVPIQESRSVPVARSDSQLLAQINNALLVMVEQQRLILAALGSTGERVSSVEVKTSTRGVDITTKAYSGSDIEPAGNAAVSEYLRVKARLEAELMGGSA